MRTILDDFPLIIINNGFRKVGHPYFPKRIINSKKNESLLIENPSMWNEFVRGLALILNLKLG